MAKTKKLEIESVIQDNEIVKVENPESMLDFELTAEITAGKLVSNAKTLMKQVETELKNYSVEKYVNDPSAAKKDKALLNKVKDSVAAKRKEVTKAWNQPLEEFMEEMKAIEKAVNNASEQLAEITKAAENQEKDAKRNQIEGYWKTLDFTLVTLDRIFNPKWLNKTFSMTNIMLEIEEITERISTELKTIRSMNDEDSEILQSFYLETLDLNATLQKGNQLKANRETLKKEMPKAEIKKDEPVQITNVSPSTPKNDPIMTYKLELKGTRTALCKLREYMTTLGIEYNKL